MKISDLIKKARRDAGLTQKELAEKIGISQVQIARYESGTRRPNLERLELIAKLLDCKLVISFKAI